MKRLAIILQYEYLCLPPVRAVHIIQKRCLAIPAPKNRIFSINVDVYPRKNFFLMHYLHEFSVFFILIVAIMTAEILDGSEPDLQPAIETDGSFQDASNIQPLDMANPLRSETEYQDTLDSDIVTADGCSGNSQTPGNVYAREDDHDSLCLPSADSTTPKKDNAIKKGNANSGDSSRHNSHGSSNIPGADPKNFRIPVFERLPYRNGQNEDCVKFSYGLLPVGVCDSGHATDRHASRYKFLNMPHVTELQHCTLGMFAYLLCPNSVDSSALFALGRY